MNTSKVENSACDLTFTLAKAIPNLFVRFYSLQNVVALVVIQHSSNLALILAGTASCKCHLATFML